MKVGKYQFKESNLDKVLFPQSGITKGDLIDYYLRVSDYMLPHLKGRPLTLQRYPNGIDKKGFFQKEKSDYFPDWIKTSELEKQNGDTIRMVLAENKATLAYLANQACVIPHTWLSKVSSPHNPDKLIFDLDPADGEFDKVKEGAKILRNLLKEKFSLESYVMSTGSKGLHIVIPIKNNLSFEEVKRFTSRVARFMADQYAHDFTVEVRKNKREGRIFIDFLRNAYAQTGVAPYSLRARKGAPVAAPLSWDELDRFEETDSINLKNIFRRLGKKPDPWQGYFQKAFSLKRPLKEVESVLKS